ncbi:jouberin-like isoform X2 [Belonocnema kinseyi]|uniref:jouberin-like isoform X2 n=1 Tax=Belonocnema kinseyi TaxID=2817044 RepID=UPI00143D20A7|nr:jouberin-like isoform X2 [Belonocnema kinseyi]
MVDPPKAELGKLEVRSNLHLMNIRTKRFGSGKSDGKSEEAMDSDSPKSHSKETRFSRKISVGDKRSTSPGKRNDAENTVIDIDPFTGSNYLEKSSKENPRVTRARPKLRRSQNVQILDVEAAKDEIPKPVPMNVVVDVHCENEILKPDRGRKSVHSPFSPGRKNGISDSDESAKKDQEQGRFFVKSPKKQELEAQESIIRDDDDIQELRESPSASSRTQAFTVRSKESRIDLRKSLKSSKEEKSEKSENEDHSDSVEPSIKGTRRRKRWQKLETVYLADDPKKNREKHWSEEVGNASLTKKKSKNSLDTSSGKEDSPKIPNRKMMMQEGFVKPVPAPRTKTTKFLTESKLAFDNEAFLPDQEEVLRIETNQENAKIKMSLVTVGVETESKSTVKRMKNLHFLDKKMENISSERSETSDLDSDDRRIEKKKKTPEKIQVLGNSEEESDLSRKESYVIRKLIRSKTFRKTGSEDTSNLENESSISRNSKLELQSRRNSEEYSSEIETHQKPSKSKVEVIRSKYSDQETTVSTNEDSDQFLDRSRQSKLKIPEYSKESAKIEEKGKRRNDKRRKKDIHMSRTSSSTRAQESLDEDSARKKKRKKKKKKGEKEENREIKFISIIVHKCDILEIDYVTRHPMVKVHIVNAKTGDYLRSLESEELTGKYLQPVITRKFDFREHRSIIPMWEEELIFEHDFEDILKTEDEQVLILFEILDLLSFSEASFNYDQYGSEGCWYKIAWAFLRPVGTVGILHINKKVRLQLYRPRRNFKKFSKNKCEVYTWWKSNKREKYPSSLFVTVSAVDPPKIEPIYYEQLALNELSEVRSDVLKPLERTSDEISLPKWSRLTAQSCKIPNDLLFETEIFENGSFYLAFSNDGKLLACTTSEDYDFSIIVYKIDEKKIHVQFKGHKNFVYSLNWSQNDQYLLSVSSDHTARLWDVHEKIIQHIQLLPHPSYVYCGKFDPANSSIVVTGCYDHVARVWATHQNSETYELLQELEVHGGFVNSICFQKDGSLLTADSVGVIVLWIIKKNRRNPINKEWQIAKKIRIKDIQGVPINTIVLHPRGSRLLVHSRNNGLRLLDLATGVVLQRYEGLENKRIQTAACISPCAGLVFCGGEDSTLNVWNLETGKQLAKYTICDNYSTVSCVDYHPYDHVLAFCTFGSPASVKLLLFDKDASGERVGLKLLVNVKSGLSTNSGISAHVLENSRTKELWSSTSKRRNLEESIASSRTFNSEGSKQSSNFCGSTVRLIENEDDDNRKENLKMKLQRFMESGPSLKTRSMHKLNTIIEKIDKILLNTSSSKSPIDLEASVPTQDKNMTLVTTNPKLDRGKRKSKAVTYRNQSENALNSNQEGIEMQTFAQERKPWKVRARSAKSSRSPRKMEEELLKTFSDSAVICRGKELLHTEDLDKINLADDMIKSSLRSVYEDKRKNQSSSSSGSVVLHQYGYPDEKRPETPDSDGTYVVEKSDLEKNQDLPSGKIFGSGSSDRSNVTFTVVSEVPVPKSRKK